MQKNDGKTMHDDVKSFEDELKNFDDDMLDAEFDNFEESEKFNRIVEELEEFKSDLTETLKSELAEASTQSVLSELEDLRSDLSSLSDRIGDMADNPDYSVMREILALREEYQSMKDEIRAGLESNNGGAGVLSEIRDLRDQMFTISMAAVSDGEEQTYESYNNIIVDEIGSVKDALSAMMTNGVDTDTTEISAKLDGIAQSLKDAQAAADRRAAALSGEIASLKSVLTEQKETQKIVTDLLSKIMAKLDKQEAQTAKLSNEIAATSGKKAERAATKPDETVMNEIKSIKHTLNALQGNDNDADNDLEASIGRLKAELSHMAGIIDGSAAPDKE